MHPYRLDELWGVEDDFGKKVRNFKNTITWVLERIWMKYVDLICSLQSKPCFISICSIRTRSRNQDIFEDSSKVLDWYGNRLDGYTEVLWSSESNTEGSISQEGIAEYTRQ